MSFNWRDYLELCKPKVVALLLMTAVIGMFLATPGMVPVDILVFGTLGIGMAAAAAAVVNHVVDRRIDAIMHRTDARPLPQGNVTPRQAIIFAGIMSFTSMAMLYYLVNPLTAWLTLFGLVGYAFVYTMYLKRATPQNIVIGGISGAIPPMLGWTAVTGLNGELPAHALLLVLIIYTWTPPHFWALAIHRRDDYAKAKIPMLPVTHGIDFTKTCILLYTILLVITTVLPWLVGMSGLVYLIGALILGVLFLRMSVKLKFGDEKKYAMKTFGFSITYLMLLFSVMLIDHYLPANPFM
ncbi:MAG: protoheme IX farnesyltransferase [Gammaproteobacteria bacterium]|nr:MAG: protoheme IX farnesyltransferase [Gammaproteobacteria bacterium]